MGGFTLVTMASGANGRAGLVVEGRVHDVATLTGQSDLSTVRAILAKWPEVKPLLSRVAATATGGELVEQVELLAALPDPATLICAGANYQDHVDNMAKAMNVPSTLNREVMGQPLVFIKASSCVVGPGIGVALADIAMDFEAELAVVIGIPVRRVSAANALACVAGYMIANDLSARSIGVRRNLPVDSPMRADAFAHKTFDGACPLGAYFVPADQVADPQNLSLKTWVNGEIRQDSNTSGMMFSTAEIISYVSSRMTLRPGDVILTGTPSGVGAETGRFLKAGDTVRIEIEGLGALETPILPEAAA